MKKIILLTTGIILFSCSKEDISDDQNLNDEIETLAINDDADADVDGDGTVDNGTDSDGDGINDLADVDNDSDGIDDNGTDNDSDGINDDDDENEYNSLSSSSLSEAVQQKITSYINANYPNDTVTEVEIENQKIKIELSSGIELNFDLNGNFVRLD